MKYPEYKNIDYAALATDVLRYWKENDIFQKSIDSRSEGDAFTFYEGPPSANGTPGIHHVMARAVKDVFCRYKTLQGFQVKRKGGWDTHGLPVELQVEKELGITKEDIGKKITVEEYNRHCREAVMKFKDQWDKLTEQMGYWVDLDDPYITFDTDYMESLWSLLKKLYEKGLLYKGFTIQPYSPAAGTGLSSHELNQPGAYREVKDTSVTAQFKVKGSSQDFFIAWTTTPWTLPSNSALAVGKNITYVKVRTFNQYTGEPIYVILAKDRIYSYFNKKHEDLTLEDYTPGDKKIPFDILEEMKGSDLVGMEYEQLMPYVSLPHPAFTVIAGDFVTTEDGTGIVHLAKPFGSDDFRALEQNGIPGMFLKDEEGYEVPLVDKQGRFRPEVKDFAGMYVKNYDGQDESDPDYKSTDVLIAIKLKEENRAFRVEKYEHNYPHCWRTDKPVLYYPLDSWFIKTTEYRDKLIALNDTINWKPEATGTGRFGNWLKNLVDWNLSRSRYWGTPLPIWRTEDGKEEVCIGSIAELKDAVNKANEAFPADSELIDKNNEAIAKNDLHRPYVDDIVLVSPSGQKMHREADLIDVWFDSGAMPYAQWHYPFEGHDAFEGNFPADFIAEGVDQTRGWFFTLHAIAGMLFDSVAYKNVIANGLVLDKNGNKMSKRLGNAIDPFKTIGKYGPDATRWYMISNANPWDDLKFNLEGVQEVQRRFFGTLQNTYNFFALYANLDGFRFEGGEIPYEQRTESDRWVLSRLNSLIKTTANAYDDYEPTRAARAIQDFVTDELSNWYVRLNRKRFWKGEYNEDKKAAYQTLYTCLNTMARLMSPIAPFYAENLYRDLNGVTSQDNAESVHLTRWPEVADAQIDKALETKMDGAQKISSLVHSLRRKHNLKVRQPLSRILIPVLSNEDKEMLQSVDNIIMNEVNVKTVEYIDDTSGILTKKIKPNFPRLGKEFGPKVKEIAAAIGDFGQEEIIQLERNGQITLQLSDGDLVLMADYVEISSDDIPGWSVANDGRYTVALDITLSDELRQEGIARELVNRVQNLRKDMGLDVQDKIKISVEKNQDLVNAALDANKEYICRETQALNLDMPETLNDGKVLEMDDLVLKVRIDV
ncbi:isoleucine--tRNA ligase [Roseivirga sp. BDSF3-8]|uniref:isoleucine--tRNA ligase n=1 Tax=Roseivirga sp. BDSF3-8 TaxID=3241598 RepID=UPI0035322DD4